MFLFLSKLLPLFIYPLGFACLLMVLALILWWKHSRWVPIPIFVALVVLLVTSNSFVANSLVKGLEWQHVPKTELPSAQAIVILGGATRSVAKPRPEVDLREQGDRIIYGAQLYRQGKAPVVIASGGRIAWRGGGDPESADMVKILKLLGVPESAVIQDSTSLNTYENAVNVKQILAQRGINQILLVTSAMHMPRALQIFLRQGIEAIPAPTDFLVTELELAEPNTSPQATLLSLLPTTDQLDKTTRVMKEYIGTLVYHLRGWL
ncbi:MAG: YdcF family protein [Symploca sp. SIO2E6]|nr:YdcF family protein [Symploca sp. SIO2E6]